MRTAQQLALELGPAPRPRRSAGAAAVQPPLPLAEVPRTARRRPVGIQREDAELYRAVEALRAAGREVYRAGALHKVDGRLLTTAELLLVARVMRLERGEGA